MITQHVPVVFGDEDPASPIRTVGLGYDEDSRRLELLRHDNSIAAFNDVGPEVHNDLLDSGLGQKAEGWRVYYHSVDSPAELAAIAAYQYADDTLSKRAGYRSRCAVCGQFTASIHHCPGPAARRSQPPIQVRAGDAHSLRISSPSCMAPLAVRTYDLERIADETVSAPGGTTDVPLRAFVPPHRQHRSVRHVSDLESSLVEGTLTLHHANGHLSYDGQNLQCDCPVYRRYQRCRHINETVRAYTAALSQQMRDDQEAWTAAVARRHQDRPLPFPAPVDRSTFSYSDNPALFADSVCGVIDDAEPVVPFYNDDHLEPIAYGYGANREFGIEIEYSVDAWGAGGDDDDDDDDDEKPDTYWSYSSGRESTGKRVARQVAAGLYSDGLTSFPDVEQYGSIRGYYSREIEGGWTAEEDSTVNGGEIISPIMSNTGHAWDSVRRVCDRIKDCGGTASHAAGSHITIGAEDFHDAPDHLNRLTTLMHHYQDDLGVMAAGDHDRSTLGRSEYAAHLPPPPPLGYVGIQEAHRRVAGRYYVLNLTHIQDADSGTWVDRSQTRLEFRLWDSSLDPGRIQAQAKISAALVDFAVAGGKPSTDRPDYQARPVPSPYHNPDDFDEATKPIRSLIDQLFHRDGDKQQAMALWAAGACRSFGW